MQNTMVNIATPAKNVKPLHLTNLQNIFISSLPNHLYCCQEKGYLRRTTRKHAILENYLQFNHMHTAKWFVFDVDRPSSHYDWDDLHAPAPNFTVTNPENGHSHLIYGLETPIFTTDNANFKPVRFAASVQNALLLKLFADRGYSGVICKNPTAEKWIISEWQPYLYDLSWLSDYLALNPPEKVKNHRLEYGLGRNCTLFDTVRLWAYSEIRKTVYHNDLFCFMSAVINYTAEKNIEFFSVPLPNNEVRSIGRSIAKWTFRKLSKQGFNQWADRRRAKSQIVRSMKASGRQTDILKAKEDHPELSNRQISLLLKCDEKTVRNALKKSQILLPYEN
jgi:hypothetical protein